MSDEHQGNRSRSFLVFIDAKQLVEQLIPGTAQHVVHLIEHHDEVGGTSAKHLSQAEKHFPERKASVGWPGSNWWRMRCATRMLVEALRQLMCATFNSRFPARWRCKSLQKVLASTVFPLPTGPVITARAAPSGSYVGKFRRQFALDVLSAHQFIRDVVKIQHLWMGDDEPSADAVKIVHHIKGMLMSTVLKDVVSKRLHRSPFPRRGPVNQGISSN